MWVYISVWTVLVFLWLGWLWYTTNTECRVFKKENIYGQVPECVIESEASSTSR